MTICCATLVTLAPTLLAAQAPTGGSRPCRIVFEERTSGGDIVTQQGTIELTSSMPQLDGSFMMMGNGISTATYTAVRTCTVVGGSPFTVQMMGMLVSDDGRTAEIDVIPLDTAGATITFQCRGGLAQTDAFVDGLPTVTLPLHHGASATFSESFGDTGTSGAVTLEFCGTDALATEAAASTSDGGGAGAPGGGAAGSTPSPGPSTTPGGGSGNATLPCDERRDPDCPRPDDRTER